jgi:NAD(P)-dependent dehydrogenase (short-subunit alcohol dehydrogenase family)
MTSKKVIVRCVYNTRNMRDYVTIQKQMQISTEKLVLPPALRLFTLEGKTALITGAGTGLGREIAVGLAMAGAEVMLTGRRREPLAKLARELEGFPVAYCMADVSVKEDVQNLVATTIEKFGKIDILINNAGTTHRSPIIEFEEEEYDRVVQVNMRSCFLCTKYVGIEMVKAGRGGSIINIGSGAGRNGLKHSIAYCASKGGMVMLTRAAAIEWAEYNIRVNIIMPGTFKTGLLHKCAEEDPKYIEKIIQLHPLGRFGEPEEIVGACIYLASDNSAFMTGDVMFIDGGGNAR